MSGKSSLPGVNGCLLAMSSHEVVRGEKEGGRERERERAIERKEGKKENGRER